MTGLPHILRVIGLPGAFTDWGIGVLGHLVGAAGGTLAVKALQDATPEELAQPADGPAPTLVLVSHGPDFRNQALAAAGRVATIVFLDEPVAALRALLASGQHPRDAVRPLTAVLAPLPPVLADPATLLLQRTPGLTGTAALQAIAAHLGFGGTDKLPPPADPPAMADADQPLSAEAFLLARQALLPLATYVLGFEAEPITWPAACFFDGDRNGEPATEVIELLGPARVIVYGPYYHMPPGRWRVEVEVYFSDATSTFKIDVVTPKELANVRLCPERGGVFIGNFPVVVERAEDRIEVRLWVERGAIEGQAALRRVTLHPLAEA